MDADEYSLMDAAEEAMWWYRAMHAHALAAIAGDTPAAVLGKAGHLLDAGCGTGGFMRRVAAARRATEATPTAMTGIEYNPEAARRAASKARAPVVAGSVNALPFADGSFTVLTSLDVLCHAGADPTAMLSECRRVLMPGGRLVLNLPALPWLRSGHDARVHTIRRYTRTSITRDLTQAGYTHIRARYWNALLLPLMIVQRKMLHTRADAPSDVGSFPPWLDAALFAATRLEHALMRLGVSFPVGGSLIVTATRP